MHGAVRPSCERPVASAATYEDLDTLREREGLKVLVPKGSRPADRLNAAKEEAEGE